MPQTYIPTDFPVLSCIEESLEDGFESDTFGCFCIDFLAGKRKDFEGIFENIPDPFFWSSNPRKSFIFHLRYSVF